MKLYPTVLLAAALLLAGCATQPKEQLAAVRAAGVSPELVRKLEHWGVLSPEDLIELKRRHVNDAVALRQLDRVGVNYVVSKSIRKQLRGAGVSQTVIEALDIAGRRYEMQFRHPYGPGWYGGWGWGYPYGPYSYDYYGLGWPYAPYPYVGGPYGPGPGPFGPGGRGPGGPGGFGGGGPGGPGGGRGGFGH